MFIRVFYFLPEYLFDRHDVAFRARRVIEFHRPGQRVGWAATRAEIYWQRACNVLIELVSRCTFKVEFTLLIRPQYEH